jgi:CMP-N-acetylneuraminic acid synthetase
MAGVDRLNLRVVAIVPARSGSKGLPNKNILPLCGKPMLQYSVEAALDSGCFDEVVLTTDSKVYGSIGEDSGCSIVYRGEELSSDKATSFDVIEHVISELKIKPNVICLLQPTSPLRNKDHIVQAMKLFYDNYIDYDFVVSVTESSHPAILMGDIGINKDLSYLEDCMNSYRRQNHCDFYPNGAMFIGKVPEYLERGDFFGRKSKAFVMPKRASVDIDDSYDYEIASLLMERVLKSEY